MAVGTIAIHSEEEGKAWVQKAKELCQETENLLNQVAATLKLVQDHSEGDIVVALVKAADTMLDFAKQVCVTVADICEAFNNVFDQVSNWVAELVGRLNNMLIG